jgi:hypothetical protein
VRFASFFSGGFINASSIKSIGKETGKMHLCEVVKVVFWLNAHPEIQILNGI